MVVGEFGVWLVVPCSFGHGVPCFGVWFSEPSNVISILISSEFLKMDALVSVVTLVSVCVCVCAGVCVFKQAWILKASITDC